MKIEGVALLLGELHKIVKGLLGFEEFEKRFRNVILESDRLLAQVALLRLPLISEYVVQSCQFCRLLKEENSADSEFRNRTIPAVISAGSTYPVSDTEPSSALSARSASAAAEVTDSA